MNLEWIEKKEEPEPKAAAPEAEAPSELAERPAETGELGQFGTYQFAQLYPSPFVRRVPPVYPTCPSGMTLACVPANYSTPIPLFPQRRFRFLFGVDKENKLGATEASLSVGGGLLGLAVLGLAGYGIYKLLT